MKLTSHKLRSIIRESILLLEKSAEYVCPPASQDVKLNTKNRNATRDKHDYGPMNPLAVSKGYWSAMARKWKGATPKEAAGMRCGNCIAFDYSSRMLECMPISKDQYLKSGSKDAMDLADMTMIGKDAKDLPNFPDEAYVGFGYCWMHHFKCHSARSCDTWAGGGPITKDSESYDWQEKSGIGKKKA